MIMLVINGWKEQRNTSLVYQTWLLSTWVIVHQRKVEFVGKHKTEAEADEAAAVPSDRFDIIKEMLGIVVPHETVAQVSNYS